MKNYIAHSLIFVCLIICLFLLDDKVDKQTRTEETGYYRVDSISSRLKYDVLPEKIYTYHTATKKMIKLINTNIN
jgi:hypothetical protein